MRTMNCHMPTHGFRKKPSCKAANTCTGSPMLFTMAVARPVNWARGVFPDPTPFWLVNITSLYPVEHATLANHQCIHGTKHQPASDLARRMPFTFALKKRQSEELMANDFLDLVCTRQPAVVAGC